MPTPPEAPGLTATPAALWGPETDRAIANFPVSGEPMPIEVVRWIARIKGAAATAGAELGVLDGDIALRIHRAGLSIVAGDHDDQFPVDVFQTGSGTSSNTNVNEVIARLAGTDVHPNDHVNLGQSSNDVVPSAVHLAALDLCQTGLVPALEHLVVSLEGRATAFADLVKPGRTHAMDAVPIMLGDEFGGYAAQIRLGVERIESALERVAFLPLGGTAVGNGLNAPLGHAERVRAIIADDGGPTTREPTNRFEAQSARDALVELSGALKVVAVSLTKIASDIVLMNSGPRCGLGEISVPELQKGSSIMPGKVNPVIAEVVLQVCAQVIGNDVAITFAGSQGNFELNARVPVIARNLLDSIRLLTTTASLFADRCVDGITANAGHMAANADRTLASAAALNSLVGYARGEEIVSVAEADGLTLREAATRVGMGEDVVGGLDPHRLATPH